MREITFTQAVNEALHQEMERDENIFVLGSDITFGGRAGMTRGLVQRFGKERVIDAPINEEIFVGIGIGAAQMGTRPVIEFVHNTLPLIAGIDFLRMGVWRWITANKVKVPLVVRVRAGEEVGAELSPSLVSFLASFRGIQVAAPSTPYQAKGIFVSALRGEKPAVIMEHSRVFRETGEVPLSPYTVPFGQGEYLKRGREVSIIAYSALSVAAKKVAGELKEKRIDVEVLNLVSLRPLDAEKIVETASKTGRVVILSDEALSGAGLPFRIYNLIKEKNPGIKIKILGAKEIPIPIGPLSEVILPEPEEIKSAVREILEK